MNMSMYDKVVAKVLNGGFKPAVIPKTSLEVSVDDLVQEINDGLKQQKLPFVIKGTFEFYKKRVPIIYKKNELNIAAQKTREYYGE